MLPFTATMIGGTVRGLFGRRASAPLVLVSCDVGRRTGSGHFMRCLALAEEFASRGWRVTFAADAAAVGFANEHLRARGFTTVRPVREVAEYASTLEAIDPDLLVLDSYLVGPDAVAAVRARGVPVVAIVDDMTPALPADLVVDPNVDASERAGRHDPAARRLLGGDYALMRDDVRRTRPTAPPDGRAIGVPKALVVLGGTDPFGIAPILVRVAIATRCPFAMTVIVADDGVAREVAQAAAAAGDGQGVAVVRPGLDFVARVARADVVLSAAGTTVWELACLGAAVGLVAVTENQGANYRSAVERGLARAIGRRADLPGAAAEAEVARLLVDADLRTRIRRRAWQTIDGRGRERVVDACERLGGRSVDRS